MNAFLVILLNAWHWLLFQLPYYLINPSQVPPVQANDEFGIFGTQFTVSAVIAFLGHVLERWFPALRGWPPRLKRALYWLAGAGTALGIHVHFNAAAGTLLLTGINMTAILHGAWHWVQSVALQEFVHGATKPNGNGQLGKAA